MPDDWRSVYNYTPVLLESFFNQEQFRGTSYKAADWKLVGATQGKNPIKSIYLYPMTKDFRLILTGRKNPV